MYRVLKEKGNNMNVTVENVETKGSVIIGRLSMEMLSILEKDGHKFGTTDEDVRLNDRWELDVSDETGKELQGMAMRMKKPKRDQSKKPSEQPQEDKKPARKQPVDVFNLIFGIEE